MKTLSIVSFIVEKIIKGHMTPSQLGGAFLWESTDEGYEYWLTAAKLDTLTDEHIEKLKAILVYKENNE